MKRTLRTLAGVTIMALGAMGAVRGAGDFMGDAERGRLLYENHCRECHTSTVHMREHRKARSQSEILGWVTRWQAELELDWSGADVMDVGAYVNATYYGYEE